MTYLSTTADIRPKLETLLSTLSRTNPHIDDDFLPGLNPSAITALTKDLSFAFPPELVELYRWRNGTRNLWFNSSTPLLLFRDHSFLPLEEALKELDPILNSYKIHSCFPFATYEGSSLVLPSGTYSGEEFERPVINVFEGIALFFFSFSTMLDTVTEWFDAGVCSPYVYDTDEARERQIWEKHNPGFEKYYDLSFP